MPCESAAVPLRYLTTSAHAPVLLDGGEGERKVCGVKTLHEVRSPNICPAVLIRRPASAGAVTKLLREKEG
jgi:hypothetical protein